MILDLIQEEILLKKTSLEAQLEALSNPNVLPVVQKWLEMCEGLSKIVVTVNGAQSGKVIASLSGYGDYDAILERSKAVTFLKQGDEWLISSYGYKTMEAISLTVYAHAVVPDEDVDLLRGMGFIYERVKEAFSCHV